MEMTSWKETTYMDGVAALYVYCMQLPLPCLHTQSKREMDIFQSSVYYERNLAWHEMGKQPILGAWSLLCHGQ